MVAKNESSKMEILSDSRLSSDTKPVKEASPENEKNFYAVEKLFGRENRSTGTCYTVQWYGYGSQNDTVDPAAKIAHHFREAYLCRLRKRQQGHNYTRRNRRKNANYA